jgi:hypothetical protein
LVFQDLVLFFLGIGWFLDLGLVFLGIGWFFWIVAHQQNKDMQASKAAQEQIHLICIGNVRCFLKEIYSTGFRKIPQGVS